jgi:hypothetical protein
MALFGAKQRRTREIAHEVLKPLGVDLKDLKETSKVNFEASMRSVVERGKDNDLYNRQSGWQKGE